MSGKSPTAEQQSSVNASQESEISVDLIGELLDRGKRLQHKMAHSSQDEDDELLQESLIDSK